MDETGVDRLQKEMELELSQSGSDKDDFMSSAQDFVNFTGSTLWRDIVKYLKDKKETLVDSIGKAETISEMKYDQGGLAMINDLLTLPESIIESLNSGEDKNAG